MQRDDAAAPETFLVAQRHVAIDDVRLARIADRDPEHPEHEEQADDAAGLLRAIDLAPAVVVGHSGGASIACALVARHPDVVRHAVAYEPPLLAVVPTGAEVVGGFRATVAQAMAEGGPPERIDKRFLGLQAERIPWHDPANPVDDAGRDQTGSGNHR